jgi:NAD-dependent SIR2 family protein deacetylase
MSNRTLMGNTETISCSRHGTYWPSNLRDQPDEHLPACPYCHIQLEQDYTDAMTAAENLTARVAELEAALNYVDDMIVLGEAPEVGDWHRQHAEASAEDCLVCIIRAVLKGNTTADIEGD